KRKRPCSSAGHKTDQRSGMFSAAQLGWLMTQRDGRWSLDNKKSGSALKVLKSIYKQTPKRSNSASGSVWAYKKNWNNINGSWISANIGWQSVRPYRQDLHFQLSEFR